MPERRTVIVVGGGIGGLSAAIALRCAGWDAQVFERAPEPGEVGAGIGLWANATRVLRRFGVLDEVVRRGMVIAGVKVLDPRGRLLQEMPVRDYGAPGVLIHRAELHAALLDALPPWAVQPDAVFERYEETGEGVRAWFAGLGVVEGEALVGADGLRSAVRAQALGDGAPVYRGYPVWRGVARDAGLARRIGGVLTETVGAGRRFGTVPIGGERVAWWATANEPEGTDDASEGRKAKLLRLFADWHAPVPELLEATPEAEILKNDTYDRPPVRHWGTGRVTLLGDAAHPTTPNFGQGGCMAIEDAAVLARNLCADADVPAALRAYERERAGRTAEIVRQSRAYGGIAQWENPVAVRLRSAMFRLTPGFVSALALRRMFAFQA